MTAKPYDALFTLELGTLVRAIAAFAEFEGLDGDDMTITLERSLDTFVTFVSEEDYVPTPARERSGDVLLLAFRRKFDMRAPVLGVYRGPKGFTVASVVPRD